MATVMGRAHNKILHMILPGCRMCGFLFLLLSGRTGLFNTYSKKNSKSFCNLVTGNIYKILQRYEKHNISLYFRIYSLTPCPLIQIKDLFQKALCLILECNKPKHSCMLCSNQSCTVKCESQFKDHLMNLILFKYI